MWVKVESKDQLIAALEVVNKRDNGDYTSAKNYKQAGWYWLEVRSTYFGRGAYDLIATAFTAEERINEIKEGIKELTDKLVEARQTVKG